MKVATVTKTVINEITVPKNLPHATNNKISTHVEPITSNMTDNVPNTEFLYRNRVLNEDMNLKSHSGYKIHNQGICEIPYQNVSPHTINNKTSTQVEPTTTSMTENTTNIKICFNASKQTLSLGDVEEKDNSIEYSNKKDICEIPSQNVSPYTTNNKISTQVEPITTSMTEKMLTVEVCYNAHIQPLRDIDEKEKSFKNSYKLDVCEMPSQHDLPYTSNNEISTHEEQITNDNREHLPNVEVYFNLPIQPSSLNGDINEESQSYENIHNQETCKMLSQNASPQKKLNKLPSTKSVKGNLFKCDICSKEFKKRYYLRLHLESHTKEKRYKCGICGKEFSWYGSLKIHLKIHTGEAMYKCDVCSKTFRYSSSLKSHSKQHTIGKAGQPHSCDVLGTESEQTGELEGHSNIQSGEKLQECDKVQTLSNSLEIHAKTQSNQKTKEKTKEKANYKCGVCGEDFDQSCNLRKHIKTHTGEPSYKCDICGNEFTTATYLKTHKRVVHTGEKPYVCDICGKRFTRPYSRKRHQDMHNVYNIILPIVIEDSD